MKKLITAARLKKRVKELGEEISLHYKKEEIVLLCILKGGFIAHAAMGDPNASIPTPQPVHYRPMFGSFGGALHRGSLTFVSQAGLNAGIKERFGLNKNVAAMKNIRGVRKQHMVHNSYLPVMEIDAQTYSVRADGQLLTCEPAVKLPLAQRYFLF